jgi:enamine deaminase RidA (YjgF/YER057c/UK114 family)
MSIVREGVSTRFCDYTIFNGIVHCVEVPSSDDAGMTVQMEETLRNLEVLLVKAGSGKHRLLMATIYIVDMERDYADMNAVWDKWIPKGAAPVRACVQVVRLAKPGWKIEIHVQAAVE